MERLRKCLYGSCLLVGLVLFIAMSAQAAVINGELTGTDPTFTRPSTNWQPGDLCQPSTTTTSVYYDTYVFNHTGGTLKLSLSAGCFEPVIISYAPASGFDPVNPCENFMGIYGCDGDSFEFVSPDAYPPGNYRIVVTSCGQEQTGSYRLELVSSGLAAVPTMNEWGLVLLVAVLAGSSVLVIRRRRLHS